MTIKDMMQMDMTQSDYDLLRVLGYVYLSNNKHEKARTVFEGLDALRPDDPETLRSLSLACLNCGMHEKALAHADRCLTMDPASAQSEALQLVRARALMAMGMDDEARGAAAKYLTRKSKHEPEHDNG